MLQHFSVYVVSIAMANSSVLGVLSAEVVGITDMFLLCESCLV